MPGASRSFESASDHTAGQHELLVLGADVRQVWGRGRICGCGGVGLGVEEGRVGWALLIHICTHDTCVQHSGYPSYRRQSACYCNVTAPISCSLDPLPCSTTVDLPCMGTYPTMHRTHQHLPSQREGSQHEGAKLARPCTHDGSLQERCVRDKRWLCTLRFQFLYLCPWPQHVSYLVAFAGLDAIGKALVPNVATPPVSEALFNFVSHSHGLLVTC